MILSNLSEIIGRKKLKISDVIRGTKISRPTLTNLYYNIGSGINFDTLSTLCNFLNVSTGDLLTYYNVDIADIDVDRTNMLKSAGDKKITFKGYLSFKQSSLSPWNFTGSFSKDYKDKGYYLTIHYQLTKEEYVSIGDDVLLAYLESTLEHHIITLIAHTENIDGLENIISTVVTFEDD